MVLMRLVLERLVVGHHGSWPLRGALAEGTGFGAGGSTLAGGGAARERRLRSGARGVAVMNVPGDVLAVLLYGGGSHVLVLSAPVTCR